MTQSPRPIVNLDEARRKRALARTIAGIGRTPPRADVKHYPGGHVWRRYPHEAVVLRAKEALEG